MSTAHTGRSSGGNGLGREQQETLGRVVNRRIQLRRFGATDIRRVGRAALDQAAHLVPLWLPEGSREGQEWVALNPTRSDIHPGSFKVNLETGQWSDFATEDKGGDLVALYAYLKGIAQGHAAHLLAEDLAIPEYTYSLQRARSGKMDWTLITPVPDSAPPPLKAHYKHGKPASGWAYRDAQGGVLCHVYRFDLQDDKEFLPLTFWRDNTTGKTAWRWKALSVPRPLYNLDKLAASPTAVVILPEGEKPADAAAVLFPECVTTTTLNGAQSPHNSDFSSLQGRIVWIWPDNDKVGRQYAERVAGLLEGIAKEVKLIRIPGNHPEGWDAANARAEGWQPAQGYELQAAPQPSPVLNAGLAECFKVLASGVWYHPPAEPGQESKPPMWICSLLKVTAYTRNNDGEAWGRLLEFKDPDGLAHAWAMPMRLLQLDGSEYRATLADTGLVIASERKARDLLTTYLQAVHPCASVRCVECTGWHGEAFVFPDETVGETGGERVLLQTDNCRNHVYQRAGTLADWQQHIARFCVGNSRLVFSVSCAFASLLLRFTGDENGGFHFRGPSSVGKTTVLSIASSVFGRGDTRARGYLQTWRATGNGLEAVAARHNDTLLLLDEIKEVDPREAGEIAYMLANGSGKSRADRSGAARDRQTWRLLFLSSGEISLADHLGGVGKRAHAGEETRLAEIPADTGQHGAFEQLHDHPSGDTFSNALTEAARRYYGTAGREYVRRLQSLEPTGKLTEKLRQSIETVRVDFLAYYVPEGASGQVQRVARRFALVAAAGELATKLGITGWEQGEALSGTVACFNAWLKARGGVEDRESQQAIAQARRFIERHGESRFTPWRARNSKTIDRAGFRRDSAQGTEFFVFPEVFKTEVCAGFDSEVVARLFVERGLLNPGKDCLPSVHRPPGMKSMRFYHFAPTILEGNEKET